MTTFLLLHSPLMRSLTWSLVAAALQARGYEALVVTEPEANTGPYWLRYVSTVLALHELPGPKDPLILVGHSGAGPLIPAVCDALTLPVAACVFADAGLPIAGASRLDLIQREIPEIADSFGALLRDGASYPNWTVEALRDLIPDADLRRQVLDDMNPRGLDFFLEPIPVPESWPDCPCAYLQFSPGYDFSAHEAAEKGWPVTRLDGGHFHMLADPVGVAEAILRLVVSDLHVVL